MAEPSEKEIKLRVEGASLARAALERIGARLVVPREFEDNLLLDDERGVLGAAGVVLRVRRTPRGGRLTFKGPSRVVEGVKTREEIESEVQDPSALLLVLERLGFRRVFRYQKYRETYAWGGQEIVIDETPIGSFFEIEGDVPGIHRAAAALGFQPSDFVTESYASLFFAAGRSGDMVFA